jgi:excinuclease ABC subunit B
VGTAIYVSATPADYELRQCEGLVVEQLIRPTGLVDPPMEVRPSRNQIDDILEEIEKRVRLGEKILITALTKRMAEEMSRFLDRAGIRNRYIHSDVDTLERVQIIEDLHADLFDVLVGVNLLREGLDMPEVSLVVILDADKEGFLRNVRSITQIAGRAARHSSGKAILYADVVTGSMQNAIEQSNRRREKQIEYNIANAMLPRKAQKSGSGQSALLTPKPEDMYVHPIAEEHYGMVADQQGTYNVESKIPEDLDAQIAKAREDMERAAKALDFLAAARYRDRMYELQKLKEFY